MVKPRAQAQPGDEANEWLSTRQVADYLGVTPDWLYHLAAAGVGPPRRQLGTTRWRYLRRDVDEWALSEPDLSAANERHRRWKERRAAELAAADEEEPRRCAQ